MKKSSQDIWIGIGLALVVLPVFLATLAPSIGSMDSGELAAVASTLGIAHPTGYPLFTLLGWCVAHSPPFLGDGRVIWKLNVFAAVLCSVGIFLFYRLFLQLITRMPGAPETGTIPGSRERLAAATGVLVLGFSRTYWLQAVSIEVYALHLIFLAVLSILFLNALRVGGSGAWGAFALVLGLSFTNHMTTILLAPAYLYLFVRQGGWTRFAAQAPRAKATVLLVCAAAFLAGLSLYLYLPIRAAGHPVLNWGDPSSLQRFWDHVSARQFRPWMFSSAASAFIQLGRFVVRFPSEFGYLPLALGGVGLADLFRRDRPMLVFSLLLFFGCVFYAVNYSIADVDAYFLLAYITTALWIAFGALALLRASKSRLRRTVSVLVCAASVFFPLGLNYRAVDQSRNFAQEDFARNMLLSLAPGAVILTDEETNFYFAAYYLQWVEGVRPDVVLLGYRALGMPWYITQIENSYPWLVRNSRAKIDAYLLERNRYEREGVADPAAYAGAFVAMVQSILLESSKDHPVYVSATLPQAYAQGFLTAPEGLALHLFRDSVPADLPAREFTWRPLPGTPEAAAIRAAYAWGYFNQGAYRVTVGDTALGIRFIRKALGVAPDLEEASLWLKRLER